MAAEETRARRVRRTTGVHICALAACLAMLPAAALVAPAAAASGPADAYASELMSVLNDARHARGLTTLPVDATLAKKARDGSIACPGEPSKVMQGRSKDLAIYGVGTGAHHLRLCPEHTVLDVMPSWGYARPVGEVVIWNLNYGSGSPKAARDGLLSSSSHSAIVLGSFGRFGCGAWRAADNTIYYVCLYAARGPATRVTPRPATPRPATPRPATARPATAPPVSTAAPKGETDVRATASPSGAAEPTATAAEQAALEQPTRTPALEAAGVVSSPAVSPRAVKQSAGLVPADVRDGSGGNDPAAVAGLLLGTILVLGSIVGAIAYRYRWRRP